MGNTRKLRLAWCGVLPITERMEQTLSAYAAEVLLPHMRREFEVELFHNSFEPYRDFATFHYLRLRDRHESDPFDICLYQIEDHPEAQYVRIASALLPGVSWFHNLYFSSHGPEPILNSAWRTTQARFGNRALPWAVRRAEHEQDAPLGRREATSCLVPIFSNERDIDEYQRLIGCSLGGDRWSEQPSYYLPLPVSKELFARSVHSQQRSSLSVLLCGGGRIEDRSHKVLAVLRELPDCHLRWVFPPDETTRVHALVEEFGLQNVSLFPELSPKKWQEHLREGDVAIHLSFSVFGQPGPYVWMSMAAGCPVLVTRFGASERIASHVVYHIPPGVEESKHVELVLHALRDKKGVHHSEMVRGYAEEIFREEKIALELIAVLQSLSSHPLYRELLTEWREFQEEAQQALLQEVVEGSIPQELSLNESQVLQESFSRISRELGWDASGGSFV
ncbi:MAG: glycosyltransferase [Bdellovibrionales bacterium]|nr:glycosyltransferase [Bdellovibrionales bacterium]